MGRLETTVRAMPALLLSFVLASPAAGASAPAAPSARELLDKYTRALDATDSYVDSYETVDEFSFNSPRVGSMRDARKFTRGQHRADGRRTYHQSYSWGDINARERNLPESSSRYYLRVEADGRLYVHSCPANNPRVQSRADLQSSPSEKAVISRHPYSGILGFVGADERLDAVLRGARRLAVRPATETVNGSACHVIDADTPYGKYTLWLDPQHGYHAARVTREATGGHKDYVSVMPRGARMSVRMETVRFEQVDGVWVPMEADQENAYTGADPQDFTRERSRCKRTKIVLDPDHEKLGSFDIPLENPAQDPQLKNGTMVRIGPIPIKGIWQDGKVVDNSGKTIDTGLRQTAGETSMRDKPLPALTGLCAGLSGIRTEGKPVLLCFVDIQQRACRQCLATLAGKAGTLAARAVVVVVVQTAPADLQQHDAFLKAGHITFPIHQIEGDFEARKAAWGVKALPWLILTDKSHIIKAEGFPLDELDDMLARVTATLFGFAPFPYDFTLAAVSKTRATIAPHSTLWALHYDDGIPWKEALADTPFPARVQRNWEQDAQAIPKGHVVYVGLAPLDKDRKSLAPATGEKERVAMPEELRGVPLDDANVKKAYLNYARRAVHQFRPQYLNLGIEAGAIMSRDFSRWAQFERLYEHVRAALKQEFPHMQIGISFDLATLRTPREAEAARTLIAHSDYDKLYARMPQGSDVLKLWRNIGLFDGELQAKPAWDVWKAGVEASRRDPRQENRGTP